MLLERHVFDKTGKSTIQIEMVIAMPVISPIESEKKIDITLFP